MAKWIPKDGDYVQCNCTKAILVCVSDVQNNNMIKCQCVVRGNNMSAHVGDQLLKEIGTLTPIQHNGLWNINSIPAPVILDAFDDKPIENESDPFGLIQTRRDLKKFILGE